MPIGSRAILALLIEIGWEIIENSSVIINRYRDTTVSLDYTGDSIINSIADSAFMLIGFWMSIKLPVWVIIILALAMEIWVGISIRDNLTLNVLMLFYPVEAIKTWQLRL